MQILKIIDINSIKIYPNIKENLQAKLADFFL